MDYIQSFPEFLRTSCVSSLSLAHVTRNTNVIRFPREKLLRSTNTRYFAGLGFIALINRVDKMKITFNLSRRSQKHTTKTAQTAKKPLICIQKWSLRHKACDWDRLAAKTEIKQVELRQKRAVISSLSHTHMPDSSVPECSGGQGWEKDRKRDKERRETG